MKWFYDLKLRTKLLTAFFMVALVAAAIGIVGGLLCLDRGQARPLIARRRIDHQ